MTMPAIEPNEPGADRVARRVMFALEFLDPVTGRVVRDGLRPSVSNLPPPLKGQTGRFVWFETDAPAQRNIVVNLTIENPMYGPPAPADLSFTIPPNDDHTGPGLLMKQVKLNVTHRYVPPAGVTGVASIVIEDADFSAVIAGATCAVAFFHDGNLVFTSSRIATSAESGEFVAFADDVGDIVPRPSGKTQAGDILGWLKVSRNNQVKYTGFLPLRRGRLTQLREPISWANLLAQAPAPPPQQ
jgi:hypothetical protein